MSTTERPLDPDHLVVGHITKAHGLKGEVFVQPLTDHPDASFAVGVVLYPGDAQARAPDPDAPPLRVDGVRPYKHGVLVTFAGVEDRSTAESVLVRRYLLRETEALAPLDEGEVFYHQLLGARVFTVEGRELGAVVEVYELMPSDLLEVRGAEGSFMIPFRNEVVVEVDVEARRIVVDPPEGLLEL